MFEQPQTLTVWGTITKPIDEEHVLRYGAEMPHEVVAGTRIAIVPGGEARLIGEVDAYEESVLVMDDNRDGDALIFRLAAAGVVVYAGMKS